MWTWWALQVAHGKKNTHKKQVFVVMQPERNPQKKDISSILHMLINLITWKKTAVHPRRLTWTIIMEVWKIIFLSKWVICRFHVNLPGCSCFKNSIHAMKLLVSLPNKKELLLSNTVSSRWKEVTSSVMSSSLRVELSWAFQRLESKSCKRTTLL